MSLAVANTVRLVIMGNDPKKGKSWCVVSGHGTDLNETFLAVGDNVGCAGWGQIPVDFAHICKLGKLQNFQAFLQGLCCKPLKL